MGVLRITNREPLTRELRSLRTDQMLLNNIINDLDFSMELDSSNAYENFISGFYSSHNIEYPDLPPVFPPRSGHVVPANVFLVVLIS